MKKRTHTQNMKWNIKRILKNISRIIRKWQREANNNETTYCTEPAYSYKTINPWKYTHVTKDLHFTSLHFTSLHFTSLSFTSIHFTSLHCTSLHFSPHFFTFPHFWTFRQFFYFFTTEFSKFSGMELWYRFTNCLA